MTSNGVSLLQYFTAFKSYQKLKHALMDIR